MPNVLIHSCLFIQSYVHFSNKHLLSKLYSRNHSRCSEYNRKSNTDPCPQEACFLWGGGGGGGGTDGKQTKIIYEQNK